MSGATDAPARAQLLCRTGELAGQTHELARSNVIGRNGDNDVVLHSSLISGKHARIWEKDGSFFVEDLGSSNGTWVDGIRITDPVRLDRLNVITFAGLFDFVFAVAQITSAAGASAAEDTQRTRLDMDFQPLPDLEGAEEGDEKADEEPERAAAGAEAPPAAPRRPDPAPPPDDDVGRTRLDMDFQPLPELEHEDATGSTAEDPETPAAGGPRTEGTPAGPDARPPADDDPGRTRLDADFQPLPELQEQEDLPASEEAPAAPRYRLQAALPDGRRQTFDVGRGSHTLGRSDDCDITLDEPSISRHHATLTVGQTLVIEDAGSVNGTLVGGSPVDRAELAPNSTFSLGPFVEIEVTKR